MRNHSELRGSRLSSWKKGKQEGKISRSSIEICFAEKRCYESCESKPKKLRVKLCAKTQFKSLQSQVKLQIQDTSDPFPSSHCFYIVIQILLC